MSFPQPVHFLHLRREVISRFVDVGKASILEVGALDSPTFTKPQFDVSYVDYATREELSKKSASNPRYSFDRLVDVTYPICGERYASVIKERFDLIVANHVVEHIPDTISWLHDLGLLLREGGTLFLSVPDKRYTFDIARRDADVLDLMRAHLAEQKAPDLINVLDHFWNTRPVKAMDVWDNEYKGFGKRRFTPEEAFVCAEVAVSRGYADVHCYAYQAPTFVQLMNDLRYFGFLGFELLHVEDVSFGQNEFHAVFTRFDPSRAKRVKK